MWVVAACTKKQMNKRYLYSLSVGFSSKKGRKCINKRRFRHQNRTNGCEQIIRCANICAPEMLYLPFRQPEIHWNLLPNPPIIVGVSYQSTSGWTRITYSFFTLLKIFARFNYCLSLQKQHKYFKPKKSFDSR